VSLSPKDDPRTWLVPGPREVDPPPLRARLPYYDLTTNECALLVAMCEYCSDGSNCWASLAKYALHSGLSEKTIGDLIHGRNYIDRRPPGFIGPMNARHAPGLIERRVLIELAPTAKPSRRHWHTQPATYLINEAALSLDKELLAIQDARKQLSLPGIRRPSVPGEPVEVAEGTRHLVPRADDTTPHHVRDHPAPRADHPAPRAGDSKAFDSKALIHKRERDSATVRPSLSPEEGETDAQWAQRLGYRGR